MVDKIGITTDVLYPVIVLGRNNISNKFLVLICEYLRIWTVIKEIQADLLQLFVHDFP